MGLIRISRNRSEQMSNMRREKNDNSTRIHGSPWVSLVVQMAIPVKSIRTWVPVWTETLQVEKEDDC